MMHTLQPSSDERFELLRPSIEDRDATVGFQFRQALSNSPVWNPMHCGKKQEGEGAEDSGPFRWPAMEKRSDAASGIAGDLVAE
jgi:hypothetical protein